MKLGFVVDRRLSPDEVIVGRPNGVPLAGDHRVGVMFRFGAAQTGHPPTDAHTGGTYPAG